MTRIPPPALLLHLGEPNHKVVLSHGAAGERDVTVPAVFSAQYDLGAIGTAQLEIRAQEGRLRVARVLIEERDDDGIDGLNLAGVPVRKLVERAARTMARFGGAGELAGPVTQKAARRRVSDERLRRVAEAFSTGGIDAVMAAEYVAERQAWRLKRAAVEKGYLDGER